MLEVREPWVGGQVWLEGAVYRVDEIDEASVLLSRAGEVRRVGLGAITARGQSMSEAEPAGGTVSLVEVLSSLSVKQRSALERELAVITRARSEENPAPVASVAKALGISVRTAQRRMRRFEVVVRHPRGHQTTTGHVQSPARIPSTSSGLMARS